MGCVVNGPGEAREADIGIACGADNAAMFKKGVKIKTYSGNFIEESIVVDIISLTIPFALSASFVISLFPIVILYQFFDCGQIILANALRGLSDVKIIMWVSLITNFLIAIPSGYLLGFPCGWGIRGVWMAYPIGFFFSVMLLGRRAWRLMRSEKHTLS